MPHQGIEQLLKKKQELLRSAADMSLKENKLIKSKIFEKVPGIDAEKNGVINSLVAVDRELALVPKSGRLISENAKQIIENINSSLNDLIKLEKENEVLISQAGDSISGKYIDSYKAYRRLK